MPEVAYCTVDDVRSALQETVSSFESGAIGADNHDVVVNAITAQSEWLQEWSNRHWFEPNGLEADEYDIIATEPLTHSYDEQDIETSAVMLADDPIEPSTTSGRYTAVSLFRRDVTKITELLVLNTDGGFDDWVSDPDREEGRGNAYYLQVDDANGWTTLYLDTDAIDDDGDPDDPDDHGVTDYRNAVVVSYEYGIEGVSRTVRQSIAMLAATFLLTNDDAALGIPDSGGNLVPQESKLKAIERQAKERLDIHRDPR